tara:strand:+ start:2292 stop:2831 length:540 start_codon:yes stop_codon:yes gene_type:complete
LSASDSPSNVVENLHTVLLHNNNSSKNKLKKFKNLKQSLENIYDYKRMIKFIYGKKWFSLNIGQKKILQDLFLEYITLNYSKRFSGIRNLKFQLNDTEKFAPKKIMVKTTLIVNENEPVNINYILALNEREEWKVFDVLYLGSISEISTKKSEFSSFLKKDGPEKLIEVMQRKLNLFFN